MIASRLIRIAIGKGIDMVATRGQADAPPKARQAQQDQSRRMHQTFRIMRRVFRI